MKILLIINLLHTIAVIFDITCIIIGTTVSAPLPDKLYVVSATAIYIYRDILVFSIGSGIPGFPDNISVSNSRFRVIETYRD